MNVSLGSSAARSARQRLAPLLWMLKFGEELSRDIALGQAGLAPTPQLQRVLGLQSRQEAMHAALFGAALRCCCAPGRAAAPPRLIAALDDFSARLRDDVAAGRLAASMIGLQCVLEGLAGAVLRPAQGELARLGDRLLPLRSFVLLQEEAHHRLGEVWLPRLTGRDAASAAAALAATCRGYVASGDAIVEAGLVLFDGYAADRDHYAAASRVHLDAVRSWATTLSRAGTTPIAFTAASAGGRLPASSGGSARLEPGACEIEAASHGGD